MQADFSRPLLAIDTSTAFLSLAVYHQARYVSRHVAANNQQSECILPLIQELFVEAGVQTSDLGAIVYAQGPGAFTGLRIGIGVAQGLAAPFHIPLIGIPCLDAVAYGVPSHACVLAATDARMGEVFYVWFDTLHHVRLSDYQVGKAAEVVLPKDRALEQAQGVGNAFALAEPLPCVGTPQMPTAVDYLKLALTGRYVATSAAQAELLYVRNKIALTASEQAARKAASC